MNWSFFDETWLIEQSRSWFSFLDVYVLEVYTFCSSVYVPINSVCYVMYERSKFEKVNLQKFQCERSQWWFVNLFLLNSYSIMEGISHTDMGKYQAMCTWYPQIGYNFRVSVRGGLNCPNRGGPINPTYKKYYYSKYDSKCSKYD